jgi:hypothetical protein
MIATELYALFDDRQTMLNSMPFPQEGSTGLDLGFTRLFLRPARHSILSGTSQQPSRSRLEAVQDFFQQPISDGRISKDRILRAICTENLWLSSIAMLL